MARNTIGIYLDQEAEIVCDPGGLFTTIPAYILFQTDDANLGIIAWQMRLEFDEGVYDVGHSLEGQALNVAIWPSMIVGLAEPLFPQNGIIALASFSIYAIQGGGIHICSLQTGELAGYLDTQDLFTPFSREYGDEEEPDASVGLAECPVLNIPDGVGVLHATWSSTKSVFK